ncbi:MAG TPA: putative dsRNA-binding protein, partial [Deltaproteobacteria bacterium]|nr:putative dsRNA-binding protein [Deltaproteobacteria bacterium]
ARHLGLGDFLLLGKGEEMDGGRRKPSLLADAYEAVIGAVFLDSSYERVSDVVQKHYQDVFGTFEQVSITDYKSILLEYCQTRFRELPRIVVARESGPEHDKDFEVVVTMGDRVVGRGAGKNKKQASQAACREALISLGHRP